MRPMILSMDYRISKNKPEIVKTLSEKLTDDCSLTVWQKKQDGSRRFLEKMTFDALYPEEGVFTLKITPDISLDIDQKSEIYFLVEDHNFVFKTKLAVDQKNILTLQIPREVQLKEHRVHERTYFSLEEKKFIEVIFTNKNSGHKMTLSCPLVNVSKGGACVVISKETISNIDFTTDIYVKFDADFQSALIRNARVFIKKELNQDEFYALGVEFQ